jgi:hypothetical protein
VDSLTVFHLARELDARWRGHRVDACSFDRVHSTVTVSAAGFPVCFDLDLADVRVRVVDLPKSNATLRDYSVRRVWAPEDDRQLHIELSRPGRFKGSPEGLATLVVSVVPLARSARLYENGKENAGLLRSPPPPAVPRPLLSDEAILAACRDRDPDRLLSGRWMSPRVAQWVCAHPQVAIERYRLLSSGAPAQPSRYDGRLFPFQLFADAEAVDSLIEPREEVAVYPAGTGAVAERRARVLARLQEELDRAAGAPALRRMADALIALGNEPPPVMVPLTDGAATVPARPGETSAVVAARLYAEARSMERALKTVPKRLAALAAALAAAPAARAAPAPALGDGSAARAARGRKATGARLPYRTYRSSGGLDIWVGRGAASNDELTFHAASPDDVWLHARDDAGAHVVLRWTNPDTPPPRDLHEAALLAAWHSRSRGSAVVPVDWTRRKHVRKPRGAKPGTVMMQQSRTVMVRPDGEVERKLRTES